MRTAPAAIAIIAALTSSCMMHAPKDDRASVADSGSASNLNTLILPAARLAAVKAALPKVAYARVESIFASADTIWYDGETMTPAYQKSTGGSGFWGTQANKNWIKNIPASLAPEGRRFVNPEKGTWVFPFATTAGTDDSTNVDVVNFISLPRSAQGDMTSISISVTDDPNIEAGSRFWNWTYPNGTTIGEIIFIKDTQGSLLPSEVRIRTRYSAGWASNVFRPFPEAKDLSAAIKSRRTNWTATPALGALVAALDSPANLKASGLHGKTMRDTFDQDGYLDPLPDFGDASLVRELLTTTPFISSYKTVWKESGGNKAFAPTTTAALSIIPNNYTAGLIEVSDESCMRCHKETARLIDNWTNQLVLYGEVWGKDGIFSLHPFDESNFHNLTVEGIDDNRRINRKLEAAGVFKMK